MSVPIPEEYAALHEEADTGGGWPLSASSWQYENARLVKAGAGKLFGLTGYNSGGAQFVLLFDAATIPADGAAPVLPVAVAATSNFGLYFGSVGRWFKRGIVVCNSSTGPTKTLGAADCYFDVQFV